MTAETEQAARDADDARGRWRALIVCLLAGFMTLLDVSIVNVALPSLRTSLHTSSGELQWIVSGYALTFGLALVPAGRLGDRYGRRRLFLVGMIVFTVTSAACAAALGSTWLVCARLAQGIGGGLLSPQITGLIQQMFRGRDRAKAFGLFGTTIGVSTAAGPLIGGLLLRALGSEHGWRLIFLINLPIGAAILLARGLLPPNRHGQRQDLDPVGIVLFSATAVLTLLPLTDSRAGLWWLYGPAALAGLALVLWQRRQRRRGNFPLINTELFRHPTYAFGSAMILLYFAGFTPLFFVLTLYLQTGVGYDPLFAGLAVTPFAIGSAVSSMVGGRLVGRIGRWVVLAGQFLVVAGLLGTIWVVTVHTGGSVGWWLVAPLLAAGIGGGLVISPNQTLTLAEVPVEQGSAAGGLLQTAQRMGAALGIGGVTALFFAVLAGSHSYAGALRASLWCGIAFVGAAAVLSAADVAYRRRHSD